MAKPVQYGGQALIEGVMMRGPREIAMAGRLPNGEIEVTNQKIKPLAQKPLFKLPVIRGLAALIDSLVIGTKALMFSANKAVGEDEGEEHKAIYAYEAGDELTVANSRQYSRLHPRCGTSFLLIVVIVSIFVFAFLGLEPLWWRILSRVLLMPLVAGIAYEILKFSGRYMDSPFLKWLVYPGILLQKLTTREPHDSQLEVAISALKGVTQTGQELS